MPSYNYSPAEGLKKLNNLAAEIAMTATQREAMNLAIGGYSEALQINAQAVKEIEDMKAEFERLQQEVTELKAMLPADVDPEEGTHQEA